jgi:hypothetical protein
MSFNIPMTKADVMQQAADESMVDKVVSDWMSLAGVSVHEDGANALIGTIAGLLTRARFGKDLIPEVVAEHKANEVVVVKTYKPSSTAIVRFVAEQPLGQKLYVSARPNAAPVGELCELAIQLALQLNEAKGLFEAALSVATRADPHDAPLPLAGAAAKTWHDANASALQWVLEMLPSADAAPAGAKPATQTWPYGVGIYGPANAGSGRSEGTSLGASILSLVAKAKAAERFIAGFEGDETQDGIDDLLNGLRQAIDDVATAVQRSKVA